jgi:uncharacterized cupin superfamily protein
MTQRPFVNVNDIELTPQTPQKPEAGFEARVAPIAAPLGATKLGCRLTVVPPGKKAFPRHVHHVNDELFVILSGEGALRFGGERYPARSGDVIVCPAGGAEKAHQLINTFAGELRYLSISSMNLPEVIWFWNSPAEANSSAEKYPSSMVFLCAINSAHRNSIGATAMENIANPPGERQQYVDDEEGRNRREAED